MGRHYEQWGPHPKLADAVKADVNRVLARKVPRKGKTAMTGVRALANARCSSGPDVLAFAEEMIVARTLSRAYLQSGRKAGAPL